MRGINKVLRAPVNERKKAWIAMMANSNVPRILAGKLPIERFLDGRLTLWTEKQKIMTPTEGKPGFLTCSACESDHKWDKSVRMLFHLIGDTHLRKCQERLDAAEREKRQALLQDHCAATTSGADIVARVQDYAVQYCATKSLPFTAATMALDCVSAAVNTLIPQQFSPVFIAGLMSNGHTSEVKTIRHINYVAQAVDTGGSVAGVEKRKSTQMKSGVKKKRIRSKRSRFRLHRTNVARRVSRMSVKILKAKAEYLSRCHYVGLIIDEGNNFSGSCPLYVSTISCDPEFNWRVMFIGQADSAGRKDGKSIHELVKEVFVDTAMEDVYKKIVSAGTDGASVMRSSARYSGLDCHGLVGTSFSAFLKRDLGEGVDFWHCLIHQFNLGLNEAVESCKSLKLFFLPHLRMCCSEFKRSSKNRLTYRALLAELKEMDKSFDWKIFYPVLFCITRWLGIQFCVTILARKSNRELLKLYAQKLRDRGCGPRAFDPHKYRRRRGIRDAADAGADDRDGDCSSEEEEIERVRVAIREGRQEDDDYVRQPRLFDSVDDAVSSFPDQVDMMAADNFNAGDEDAANIRKKNMLNPNVGLTDLNAGRAAYLSGALTPYKVLVEALQRSTLPEQHLAARRIRTFYMVMQASWVGTRDKEPMFACRAFSEWIQEMLAKGKDRLVKLVKKECSAFCSILVASVRERLRTTWQHIQALELVDPLGPELESHTTPAIWDALQDICSRRGLDYHSCKEQILTVRAQAESLDIESKAMIRMDLCGYLRDRHSVFVMTQTESPTPDYDKLCAVVFSIPLTSSFVESLFSKMVYNQSKIRSRLRDSRLSSILHLHDSALPNPQQSLPSATTLKVMCPRSLKDQLTMNKNVGRTVCCVFEDSNRYHGEVTKVIYHDIHAQFMYHVVYEDGDEADYWRHELEMITCRCDDRSNNSDSN